MQTPFNKSEVNKIRDYLLHNNESISVAESVTAGLLQSAIASADDASQFFQGGITAYNIGQKSRHLQIEPIHALSCNCVSEKVAEQMAMNVCKLFNSNWGIGITGYSSPVPESNNKIFCYYAIVHNQQIILKGNRNGEGDDPYHVQLKYVQELLTAFLSVVKP